MFLFDEFLTGGFYLVDAVGVGGHVGFQEGVFLLEVLDGGEVLAVVFGREGALYFAEPELNVFHGPVEGLLLGGVVLLEGILFSFSHGRGGNLLK